jgi:hypothetical protein
MSWPPLSEGTAANRAPALFCAITGMLPSSREMTAAPAAIPTISVVMR